MFERTVGWLGEAQVKMVIRTACSRWLVLLAAIVIASGTAWGGGDCPSECFCVPPATGAASKAGRSEKELRSVVAAAPEGSPIVLKDVREAVLARKIAPDHLVLLERTAASSSNISRLKSKPSKITVLHNAPDSVESAEVIHRGLRGSVTGKQVRRIQADLKVLAEAAPVDLAVRNSGSIRDSLLTRVHEAGDGELVVIIAHLEDGVLRFSDRSHVLPAELEAANGKALVWVLGCNTLKQAASKNGPVIGIGKKLVYREAFNLAAEIERLGRRGEPYEQILSSLQKVSPAIIGIVGLMLYLEFADEEDDRE